MRGSQKPIPSTVCCPGLWGGTGKSGRTRTTMRSLCALRRYTAVALYFSERRAPIRAGGSKAGPPGPRAPPRRHGSSGQGAEEPDEAPPPAPGGSADLLDRVLERLHARTDVLGRLLLAGFVLDADHARELHRAQ